MIGWGHQLVALLAACLLGGAAVAAPPVELLREIGLAPSARASSDVASAQRNLAWVGLYRGPLNGEATPTTTRAIRDFQVGLGAAATGSLSDEERATLARRASATQAGYRFVRRTIDWLGISLDVPMAILEAPALSQSDSNSIEFAPIHHSGLALHVRNPQVKEFNPAVVLKAYIQNIKKNDPEAAIRFNKVSGSGFVIVFETERRHYVLIAETQRNQWRIVQASIALSSAEQMRPVLSQILRSVDMFSGTGLNTNERQVLAAQGNVPGSESVPEWFKTMTGNGSGSLVSLQGHILTNQHVVEGCARLTVNGSPSVLIGTDARLDLALVRAPAFENRRPIRFRADNPQLGEVVAVMGYPLFRYSRALNFTTGTVSSTVGLNGDRTRVQVTAPIQPGNSGGPVLDANGRQVAVVVAKASVSWQDDANVENVGWVIRGQNALSFLERFGVSPIIERTVASAQLPAAEEIDRWRPVIARIECHHE